MDQEREWFEKYFVVRCDTGDTLSPYYASDTRTGFASIKDETGKTYQSKLFIFDSATTADTFIQERGNSRRKFSTLMIEPLTAEVCGCFCGWYSPNPQPKRTR
jgi:hypothetical protein